MTMILIQRVIAEIRIMLIVMIMILIRYNIVIGYTITTTEQLTIMTVFVCFHVNDDDDDGDTGNIHSNSNYSNIYTKTIRIPMLMIIIRQA